MSFLTKSFRRGSRSRWTLLFGAFLLCSLFVLFRSLPYGFADAATFLADITPERLLETKSDEKDWLTGGRDYQQRYYSPLADINTENVGKVGFAWEYDIGPDTVFEATPTVVDGVMFTSGMRGAVYALDAKTGAERWRFEPKITPTNCAGRATNRGVAVWRGKVYVGSLDGYLYALDATTGKVVWKADTIIDRSRGYSSTGAPYVANDKIIIGNAGAECDARGYVTAYDYKTGKQLWRFFTVPGDPKLGFEHPELKMAAKTWSPKSLWEVGLGGTAWDGMAYDPVLNLFYVGTGNGTPWTRYSRSPGGGDNLFLSSILAINPDTGRLVWHYQTTPGDNWDFTATQKMILADLKINGRMRKVIMQAPKNGFFYVLDRRTGELLSAKPYATVTWASHVDLKTGRPKELPQGNYSKQPKLVFPGTSGAHNWHPMAYSPKSGLVYIPARDYGLALTLPDEPFLYRKGQGNTHAGFISLEEDASKGDPERLRIIAAIKAGQPDPESHYFIRAWNPAENKLAWQVETQSWNGVLATAGGLILYGRNDGQLTFLNAKTGAVLHRIDVGQNMSSAAMSYKVDGEQYIAIMADDAKANFDGFAVEKAGENGRIVVFKLGGGEVPKRSHKGEKNGTPHSPGFKRFGTAEQVRTGRDLFDRHCAACHMEGGGAPNLTRMDTKTHESFLDIVLKGLRADRGMASFSGTLSEQDAKAIHAYLTDAAWAAYEKLSSNSGKGEGTEK